MTQCSIGRTLWSISVLGAVLLTAATPPSAAQDIGDVSEGHRLAETWCVNCHIVAPNSRGGTEQWSADIYRGCTHEIDDPLVSSRVSADAAQSDARSASEPS